jgi:hypothetical protein
VKTRTNPALERLFTRTALYRERRIRVRRLFICDTARYSIETIRRPLRYHECKLLAFLRHHQQPLLFNVPANNMSAVVQANDDRQKEVLVVAWVTTGAALVTVAIKIFTRLRIVRVIGWDDFFIVFSMVRDSCRFTRPDRNSY